MFALRMGLDVCCRLGSFTNAIRAYRWETEPGLIGLPFTSDIRCAPFENVVVVMLLLTYL